jgi:hypothetical protein
VKTTALPASTALLLPLVLGIAIIAITYAVLTGKQLPLISGPRAGLIALLIVGMSMCALGGIGQVGASGRWASPLAILGYLLGAGILLVIVGGLAGWKLPMIPTEKVAVLAAAAMIGVKTSSGQSVIFFTCSKTHRVRLRASCDLQCLQKKGDLWHLVSSNHKQLLKGFYGKRKPPQAKSFKDYYFGTIFRHARRSITAGRRP